MDARHRFDESLLLNEDVVGPVDHDLADGVIEDKVLDRLEKREDRFESVH